MQREPKVNKTHEEGTQDSDGTVAYALRSWAPSHLRNWSTNSYCFLHIRCCSRLGGDGKKSVKVLTSRSLPTPTSRGKVPKHNIDSLYFQVAVTQVLGFHSEEAVEEISRHGNSSHNSPCCLPDLTGQVKSTESNKWQTSFHVGAELALNITLPCLQVTKLLPVPPQLISSDIRKPDRWNSGELWESHLPPPELDAAKSYELE